MTSSEVEFRNGLSDGSCRNLVVQSSVQFVKAIRGHLAPAERMPYRPAMSGGRGIVGRRVSAACASLRALLDITAPQAELQLHGFVKRFHGSPRVAEELHAPNEALTKRSWARQLG